MIAFTVLIHTGTAAAVAAHHLATPWGSREAVLLDGEWVGVAPFEVVIAQVDLEDPAETFDVETSDGTIAADRSIFERAV